jgi:hypothetical protein
MNARMGLRMNPRKPITSIGIPAIAPMPVRQSAKPAPNMVIEERAAIGSALM